MLYWGLQGIVVVCMERGWVRGGRERERDEKRERKEKGDAPTALSFNETLNTGCGSVDENLTTTSAKEESSRIWHCTGMSR